MKLSVNKTLSQAKRHAKKGEIARSAELYNTILAEFPGNTLGAANAGLGRLDDAVDSFRRAIAVDPGVAEAHYNHGLALKNKGDLAAAIENYKRAIEIRPAYPEAFYNLGSASDADRVCDPSAGVQ